MQGQTVFRWAVWGMAPVAQQALDAAGVTVDQLDAFIPHQANVRIVDAMAKQLKIPADVAVARDIAYTGNTSAASVPLAMERMVRRGEVPRGGLALQIGFRRADLRRAGRRHPLTHRSRGPTGHPGHPQRAHPRRDRRSTAMAQSEQEILAGLAEIVNEETGLDPAEVQSDKSFTDDLDIDSLSMMTIVVNAEEKFGVRIPDDEVKNLTTVGDAVGFIAKNQA